VCERAHLPSPPPEKLQKSRSLSPTLPAMYDPCNDTHQMYFVESLRALTQDVSRRLFEQVPFFAMHISPHFLNTDLFTGCLRHRTNASSLHAFHHRGWPACTSSWRIRAPCPLTPRGAGSSALGEPRGVLWRTKEPPGFTSY
jgi:hypothetical protein